MTYVLENMDIPGEFVAKDFDTAIESELPSGDVVTVKDSMKFKDEHELMLWAADAGKHKAIMKFKFGKDALVSMDIDEVLKAYRPKKVNNHETSLDD